MNIFDIIPIGFFNPLASGSNNRIYFPMEEKSELLRTLSAVSYAEEKCYN